MKKIEWTPKALRQLRKIKDAGDRNRIYDAVSELQYFPDVPNVKKVKGIGLFRLRVGRWRVFFTDSLKIVLIKEVKKRNERTYS